MGAQQRAVVGHFGEISVDVKVEVEEQAERRGDRPKEERGVRISGGLGFQRWGLKEDFVMSTHFWNAASVDLKFTKREREAKDDIHKKSPVAGVKVMEGGDGGVWVHGWGALEGEGGHCGVRGRGGEG